MCGFVEHFPTEGKFANCQTWLKGFSPSEVHPQSTHSWVSTHHGRKSWNILVTLLTYQPFPNTEFKNVTNSDDPTFLSYSCWTVWAVLICLKSVLKWVHLFTVWWIEVCSSLKLFLKYLHEDLIRWCPWHVNEYMGCHFFCVLIFNLACVKPSLISLNDLNRPKLDLDGLLSFSTWAWPCP